MTSHIMLGASCLLAGIIAFVMAQHRIDRVLGEAPPSIGGRGILGLAFFVVDVYRALARAARHAQITGRAGAAAVSFFATALMVFGFVLLARGLLALPR